MTGTFLRNSGGIAWCPGSAHRRCGRRGPGGVCGTPVPPPPRHADGPSQPRRKGSGHAAALPAQSSCRPARSRCACLGESAPPRCEVIDNRSLTSPCSRSEHTQSKATWFRSMRKGANEMPTRDCRLQELGFAAVGRCAGLCWREWCSRGIHFAATPMAIRPSMTTVDQIRPKASSKARCSPLLGFSR